MPRHPLTLVTLTLTLLFILSQLADITVAQHWILVDDTDPDINYTGNWKQGPCGTCVNPNLTNVHNETWHETTPGRSSGITRLTFQFTGYAVLFGMLLDDVDANLPTSIRITLDDAALDWYRDSANDGTIQTGAINYYKDQLAFTQHTLTIDVNANSIFMLDYIAYEDLLTDIPETSTPGTTSAGSSATAAPSGTQSPSISASDVAQSTTSKIVSVGPSGTTTLLTALPVTGISGLNGLNTLSRATTSFDISTFSISNMQEFTVQMSTSTDSAGHTLLVPVVTVTDSGYGASPTGNHSSTTVSSDNSFSPALAGAIGAAVAAVSAVLIVVFMVCMRRRRGIRPRPSSAEPYMLANSTPSSQNSSLTPRLSPYQQESVLGLFTLPQGVPDYRTQPDFLLSSPPPNHSLMSPISPNQQYYPSQNITVTTPSSEQYLNPHTNSNSLTTPISPNHPQPFYFHAQPHPNQSYPMQQYYTHAAQEKLSRHPSNNHLSVGRRQSSMAELRSPVTPLIPRPADWNIESLSETGERQTPAAAPPPPSPAMLLPSPAIITPSPHSSRRRSGRQKEIIEEELMPPPPVPQIPRNPSGVPILGHPSALRRGRRRTDGAERPPRRQEDGGVRSSEESIAPVVRRQSFSHPAPPAYSPPRLVRNRDLYDVLLD